MDQFKVKRWWLTITMMFILTTIGYAQQQTIYSEKAVVFLTDQMNHCQDLTYVFRDGNSGCNYFIPLAQGDVNGFIKITQQDTLSPVEGRSSGLIFYSTSPQDTSGFAAWTYTYGLNNFGQFSGLDVSSATELRLWVKGKGVIEVTVGGTNRPPFRDPSLPREDGLDVRGSGWIQLKESEWTEVVIDLTDTRFWVFKGVGEGANNKFPKPVRLEDLYDCSSKFEMFPESVDETGHPCIKASWNKPVGASCWGGHSFTRPQLPDDAWFLNGVQGYDLTGLTGIYFKAKMTKPGGVQFLFGSDNSSCGTKKKVFQLDANWQWYYWEPTFNANSLYNVVVGFGLAVAPGAPMFTPDGVDIFLDSIYYQGVSLKNDLSNLIKGCEIVVPAHLNPDTSIIQFDELALNHSRLEEPKTPQSFVVTNDPLDITQQMTGHVYDASLALMVFVSEYYATNDGTYLDLATRIGEFFWYAMHHDRYFSDGRLRNVYKAGPFKDYLGLACMPGHYDEKSEQFIEDVYDVSTSVGNMSYAGLSLLALYEATQEEKWLDATEILADWCIENAMTDFGFLGGREGWGGEQIELSYRSTEHNLDAYSLFDRLYCFTGKSIYLEARESAATLVYAMWNAEDGHFWTGTEWGTTEPNTCNVPSDLQFWYPLAFQDFTSPYAQACLNWAKNNCLLLDFDSPNYNFPLSGFDFNFHCTEALDGIWFEGTSQAALAYKLAGNYTFGNFLSQNLRSVQHSSGGIPAATQDHVSTGFSWEYHHRYHVGATAWFYFSEVQVNPYYLHNETRPVISPPQQSAYCPDDAIVQLNATPSDTINGHWSGVADSLGHVDPKQLEPGEYEAVYSYSNPFNCQTLTDTLKINILQPPQTSLVLPDSIVSTSTAAFDLSGGSPEGGTYSIGGTTYSTFDPSEVDFGNYSVTYCFTNENGCRSCAKATLRVETPSSVSESGINSEKRITVSPNPGTGTFSLNALALSGKTTAYIYDLQGRRVKEPIIWYCAEDCHQTINLSNLNKGIYLIRFTNQAFVQSTRLLIQ